MNITRSWSATIIAADCHHYKTSPNNRKRTAIMRDHETSTAPRVPRNITGAGDCSATSTVQRRAKVPAVSLATALIVVLLSGCSAKAGDMSCEEFGQLPATQRTPKIMDMIEEHGLEPLSNAMATASLSNDVTSFCGTGLVVMGLEATKNLDQPIRFGVDWSQYGG